MSPAHLTTTLATLHAAGVRWTIAGGGLPVPGVRPGRTLTDATRTQLAALRPLRSQLTTLAQAGRCPGCGVHALPPLQVCYWCVRGRQ